MAFGGFSKLGACLLALALSMACSTEPAGDNGVPVSGPEAPDASEQVEATFQDYKEAALSRDGDRAAELVTDSTIDYYEQLLDLTKNADKRVLRQEALADQFAVLLFRQLADPTKIAEMDGKAAIAFAIDEGLIGEEAVRRLELGTIAVYPESETATGEVAEPSEAAGAFKFEFEYDDGRWRIDISALLDLGRFFIRNAFERSNLSEEEFLAALIESSSGKRFSPSLWEPTGS